MTTIKDLKDFLKKTKLPEDTEVKILNESTMEYMPVRSLTQLREKLSSPVILAIGFTEETPAKG